MDCGRMSLFYIDLKLYFFKILISYYYLDDSAKICWNIFLRSSQFSDKLVGFSYYNDFSRAHSNINYFIPKWKILKNIYK